MKENMEVAEQRLHISVEDAQQYEEKVTNSFLYSVFVMSQAQAGSTDMLPLEGKLYVEEHSAISNLARQGKAVFVGHCASEALKEESGVLRVFIRADEEFKKKRANYYAVNTSKKWEDPDNYDMILDSSKIGIDGCVKAIVSQL